MVTVAASGDYGKPRPAVIVQTNAFPDDHPSIIVCQITSSLIEASDFRITLEPTVENGLQTRSQIMVDKPVAVRRSRIGQSIGRLATADIARLNTAIAFVTGLAD